jgi:AcrR family transcriptional regulator
MSVEGVAAEAGVGKTTIYRRYASKEDLVVAAVSSLRDPSRPFPDLGGLRADIAGMMAEMRPVPVEGIAPLLGALFWRLGATRRCWS